MKTHKLFLYAMILAAFGLGFAGCSDEDDEDDPFIATQADLDAAMTKILEVNGDEFQDFAHNGTDASSDSTYRVIYANTSGLSGNIPKGTIVAKHTYSATPDGQKGDKLFVTFAMIKREAGYNPDSDDWEFAQMPNDGSHNYSANPHGTLPSTDSPMRGKLGGCISCHNKAAGGDMLFVNDK